MPHTVSIQCCYATYISNVVQVEVRDGEDVDTALNRGIEEANFDDGWKKLDYEGPIFIAAACNGASSDPGASANRIEVPHLLTERGQMQLDIPSDARPSPEDPAMPPVPPQPSTEPAISYDALIHVASTTIFALKHAGYRFTTTIDRERNPVPGNPAYLVFIALHDDETNGLVPHTMIDISIAADDPRPQVIVHDKLLGRYPQHLAKEESLRRFRERLARHRVCFPMRTRL